MNQDEITTVYGADWCADCKALKGWLNDHGITYTVKDTDDPLVQREVAELTKGSKHIPVLKLNQDFWIEPSYEQLEKIYNKRDEGQGAMSEEKIHDVIMIGAGPTSLAAAVYTAREDIETLIIEKGIIGGLAAITDKVDNYPGFPEGIEGLQLAENLRKQAERFGAVIELDEVQTLKKKDDIFEITTAMGHYLAKAVLVGTGSEWKKLGIPGEAEFYGRGVHNCATCDGAFYRDKKLVVVGSGNSSAQEALFLTRFASHIDILIRGAEWKASDVLVHEIEENDKITVHFNTAPTEIVGGDVGGMQKVTAVKARCDDKEVTYVTDGVFVFIGLLPVTYFLKDTGVELDDRGFVVTDQKLMTAVSGLFCAGDVRSGATMQIASAVGEGASAALSIREYLEKK